MEWDRKLGYDSKELPRQLSASRINLLAVSARALRLSRVIRRSSTSSFGKARIMVTYAQSTSSEPMTAKPGELEPGTAGAISIEGARNSKVFTAHGIFGFVANAPNANKDSICAASICEVDAQDRPFLGAALMHVANVVPYDEQRIEVWGNIGWDSDIRVRLSLIWF
ncbi:hypothetical protein [Streptomyces sp. NPDC058695]|uniref:hypothetical protein n=1 Tax=Streptomyces sp. NPDC058695 TaxID=3346604 RepID=UPI00365600CE